MHRWDFLIFYFLFGYLDCILGHQFKQQQTNNPEEVFHILVFGTGRVNRLSGLIFYTMRLSQQLVLVHYGCRAPIIPP